MSNPPEEWISAGEAAAMLGITTRHLTRLADEGVVIARRLWERGNRTYLRTSVEDLVTNTGVQS
jgi:DNA-binding transcriptional MerR regulator